MQKKTCNIEPIEPKNRGSFIEETMIQMTWFDCWISSMGGNVTLPCILAPYGGILVKYHGQT